MWRGSLRRNLQQVLSESRCYRPNAIDSCLTRPFHHVKTGYSELSCYRDSVFRQNKGFRCSNFELLGNWKFVNSRRSYATAAAEAHVSASEEEVDEIQELRHQTTKQRPQVVKLKHKAPFVHNYHQLKQRQLKIECDAWKDAAKEYQELLVDMCEHKLAPNLPYMKSLFLGWYEPLKNTIEEEQEQCRTGKKKPAYAPCILQLPADMMAVITMHKFVGLIMTSGDNGSCRVVNAACHVGEAIEHEARIHRFLENSKRKTSSKKTSEEELDDKAKEQLDENAKKQQNLRKKVEFLMKKKDVRQLQKILSQQDEMKSWDQDLQVKLGSRLIQILMETAHIQAPADQLEDAPPEIRPAFVHKVKTIETKVGMRKFGVIECDPLVVKGLEKSARHTVIPYMPMLIPPVKWTRYNRGAYLFLPSDVMRIHGARRQREALKMAPKEQLQPVFLALNTLGNTKWRVNKRILSVIDTVWANGGGLADLVDRDDVPLPVKPDTEDELEMKQWRWKFREAMKENKERHSSRCDVELKLAVARKMKDEGGFFYPHNIDFRGRAYPMHPYLTHLGSDLCRGILEFAEGRPLGKSGLGWLKVHLANVFGGGFDKLSYDGRISFAEDNLNDIFDSADRPLDGNRWWLNAEDPFQCLSVCMELSEALRSPYPESTISHVPVHQDGSCNGLQHYAAIGRDKLGAEAVNLVRADKPADVYSGIAARVLNIMERDAAKDPEVNKDAISAKLLIKQVDRKFVKQTVMTSVYGITFIGARDQIMKRLKERGVIEKDNEVFIAANYAAKTILTALEEMFTSARNIMNWLGDCAKVIAATNQPVRWTTPLGLPVVQPYHAKGRHMIKTSLQVLSLQRPTDKVMVKRQKTAFPPNFVHSLDGSHMMMTAIACSKEGLNFAGVHDSYWTHACDVDLMNKILREKFVELYSRPILENLLDSFQESFPDLSFPPLPARGDFDLKEVLDATYFFN